MTFFFPGLPQDAPHRSVHRFGQPLQNVARLVNLATLDRRIASKGAADRLGQRLRVVLRFHETERPVRTASVNQVRQPIYRTSAGRWRTHAAQLQPLLAALAIEES